MRTRRAIPVSERWRELNKRRMLIFGALFTVVNLAVLALLVTAGMYRESSRTMTFADETVAFLESSCEKYERYDQNRTAEKLQALEDVVMTFTHFLPSDRVQVDDDLLEDYIAEEHLDGMIVLDENGGEVCSADRAGRDVEKLWKNILSRPTVAIVVNDRSPSYEDVVKVRGTSYLVCAVSYDKGLVFAYKALDSAEAGMNAYGMDQMLTSNTFHRNPTVLMVQGSEIVSSNKDSLTGDLKNLVSDSSIDWTDKKLTRVMCDGQVFYGMRAAYRDYLFYVLYPQSEMLSGIGSFIAVGVSLYLAAAVAVLLVRYYFERRNLRATEKQLAIIDAISATYISTFLLHLETMELENLNMSPRAALSFAEHPDPHEFLENFVRDAVMPEHREQVLEFMDVESIEERLDGKTYLGMDVQGSDAHWYSLQLIPQRRDDEGRLLTVLVATRDITAAKQAEELSYRDKLTGLRNRNYLESRNDELLAERHLPVTLVMADCNYLKRTNDTMGHEWGDILLKRCSAVLSDVAVKRALPMRIGGDEFLLVCPHTDSEAARDIVEQIELGFAMASDERLKVSASLGVCTVTNPCITFKEAFAQADEDMYKNKRAVHERDSHEGDRD